MNTKHTPGPWYEYDMGWSGQTAIAVKHANSNFLIVPAMNKGANARLIAAAPELLAAALRVQSFMDDYVKEGYESAMRRELRAAIAKATNETL